MVKITAENNPWLHGLNQEILPAPLAIRAGACQWSGNVKVVDYMSGIVAQYVNYEGHVAEYYPENPTGSDHACAMIANTDQRILVSLVHPERVIYNAQLPHRQGESDETGAWSPWMRLWANARVWVAKHPESMPAQQEKTA